ncbi:hypothetical protein N9R79_01005 [Vibrio sp.]|nr:hypothetical protein [Vibrio sp.]
MKLPDNIETDFNSLFKKNRHASVDYEFGKFKSLLKVKFKTYPKTIAELSLSDASHSEEIEHTVNEALSKFSLKLGHFFDNQNNLTFDALICHNNELQILSLTINLDSLEHGIEVYEAGNNYSDYKAVIERETLSITDGMIWANAEAMQEHHECEHDNIQYISVLSHSE